MSGLVGARLAAAIGVATLATSCAAGAAWLLSRRFRRDDAGLWHSAWTALAVASLAALGVGLLPPVLQVRAAAIVGSTGIVAVHLPPAVARALATAGVIYLAGAVVMLGSVAIGLYASIRLRRTSCPLDAAGMDRIARVVPAMGRNVRVQGRLRLPVTVGWRRAVILVPALWTAWDDERLRAVLRHESAHIARRDFVWHAIAALHRAAFWMNPIAWLVARRIRLAAELDADRIAAGDARAAYARQLVAAAAEAAGLEVEHSVFAPGATHDLSARIDALLADAEPAPPSRRGAHLIGAALAAAIIAVPMFVHAAGPVPPPGAAPQGGEPGATHAVRHALRHGAHGGRSPATDVR